MHAANEGFKQLLIQTVTVRCERNSQTRALGGVAAYRSKARVKSWLTTAKSDSETAVPIKFL